MRKTSESADADEEFSRTGRKGHSKQEKAAAAPSKVRVVCAVIDALTAAQSDAEPVTKVWRAANADSTHVAQASNKFGGLAVDD